MRRAALAALTLAWPALCAAIMPSKNARQDGRFKAAGAVVVGASDETIERAIESYNRKAGSGIGAAAATGGAPARPEGVAEAFLEDSKSALGIEVGSLALERRMTGRAGLNHVLYQQTYKGVPVEFGRVKVHWDDAGAIVGASSRFKPRLDLDVTPSVSAAVAAYAVKRDAGAEPRSRAELVIFPDPGTGEARLAWKFTVRAGGRWRYYVDAHSGELLFRYDDLRYGVCPVSQTSGTISGQVFPLDSQGSLQLLPMAHQRVFVGNPPVQVDTDAEGFFCAPNVGKVFTQLQGPFVNVASARGPSAHYDNGSGTWTTVATPVSSPHPYPNDAVLISTIDLSGVQAAANAVKFLPIFTSFEVGEVTGADLYELADVVDDDQLAIIDSSGNVVASYLGSQTLFNATAVPGKLMRLRLKSNATGTGDGYTVAQSSFLTLSNPNALGQAAPNTDGATGSFTWYPASHTSTGLRGEISLFYHLNRMHDYFAGDVNRSSYAWLTPVNAMAFQGPNLVNAFYDPDYDNLFFGDVSRNAPSDLFADDATVTHHEYTHYVLEKIWPIQNFGQGGAISEALADYFAASSLNHSSIGKAVVEGLGGTGALRQLDCVANPPCRVLGGNYAWSGEIHDDSVVLSQALWDLRRDRVALQGATSGRSCADNLVFQALLFFPESFSELQAAMTRVDAAGAAPSCTLTDAGPALCGGVAANCVTADAIAAKFAAHGLQSVVGTNDPYDTAGGRNDGFETAVDITTIAPISATIYPSGDSDFFTFGAGPGRVELELDLPQDGFYYKGYMMTLYDRDRRVVATASPPYNGIDTDSGYCTSNNCTTTAKKTTLSYQNAAPNQFYLHVSGGPTLAGGSSSGVNSTSPYVLRPSYPRQGALSGSVVSAQFDGDVIDFSVRVTSFPRTQDLYFAYAQLRDQSETILPNTLTHMPSTAGDYLLFVTSQSALGWVTGRVSIASGFANRFPSVGTVKLEVFAYNVAGSTISLGYSQPINLSTNKSEVKAWNNVFNPARGQKTTIKYDVQSPGRLRMRLYTLNGAFVASVFDDFVSPGKGSVDWAGRNTAGALVASGIYLLQVEGPGISKTQKIAVVK